jgi:Uma2 family endonuclease
MDPARKGASFADLLALPDDVVGELISGELITSPRPRPRHARVIAGLMAILGPPFQFGDGGHGGWILLPEPEIHLGQDAVVPDVAGWRKARWSTSSADAAFIDFAPDWICEVLSPTTARLDRMRKMPIYLRERVGHAWLVDPANQTLEVFAHGDSRWSLLGSFVESGPVRAEPFAEIEFELSRLWL